MELISSRKLRDIISRSDVVLEVVDIRNPIDTRPLHVERMIKSMGKDIILVLNKCDLVPLWVSKGWARYFRSQGIKTIFTSATKRYGSRILRREIMKLIPAKPAVLSVIGYPKVGKSSIVNMLKGRDSAPTSPTPGSTGYTKRAQLYKIADGIYLIDTPGIVLPQGDSIEAIIRRSPVESFKDPVPIAVKLIEYILNHVPTAFHNAYGISDRDPLTILEKLALKRGWIYKSTKEPNIEEAARQIIRDYHKGKIPFYIMPPL